MSDSNAQSAPVGDAADQASSSVIQKSSAAMRRLREARDFNQEEMAEALGISVATLRAIEIGRRAVSERTAQLAEARFGVFAGSLLSGEPMTLLGERVTEESLNRVCADAGMQKMTAEDIAMFMAPLKLLFKVAAYQGRLLHLAIRFKQAFIEVANDLGLDKHLKYEAYQSSAKPVSRKFTRKELRDRRDLAEALGIKDDPNAPETETLIVQTTVRQGSDDWLASLSALPKYEHHVGSDGTPHFRDRVGMLAACQDGLSSYRR